MGDVKSPVVVGYKYGLCLHMVCCSAPVTALTKIKIGDRIVWSGNISNNEILTINKPELFGGDAREGGVSGVLGVYFGDRDQPALPDLKKINQYNAASQMRQSSPDSPAYRGVLSLVWHGLLTSNNPYFKPWEVEVESFPSNWYPEKQNIDGDINPVHIIHELITSSPELGGLGLADTLIDQSSFKQAADTLYDEGFGLSFGTQNTLPVQEFINTIEEHLGGQLYQDPITQRFVFKLFRADYDVDELPVFDEDNIVSIKRYSVAGWGETVNELTIKYTNPATFEPASITVQDIACIDATGAVIAEERNFLGIHNPELAQRVALRELAIKSVPQSALTLELNRQAARLNIGDVFLLSNRDLGIDRAVYRAISIDIGTITAPTIRVEAAQDVFGLPEVSYVREQPSLWTSTDVPAVAATVWQVFDLPYFFILSTLGERLLREQDEDSAFVGTLVTNPGPGHVAYDLAYDAAVVKQNAPFNQQTTLAQPLDQQQEELQFASELHINPGDYLLVDDELLYCAAASDGAIIQAWRAVLDTVPQTHAVGARVWVISRFLFGTINTDLAVGERIYFKILPRTTIDRLDEASVGAIYHRASDRYQRPYPPSEPLFNGVRYPENIDINNLLTISWSSRNRDQQTAPIPIKQTHGNITAPTGVTYTLILYRGGQPLNTIETEGQSEVIDFSDAAYNTLASGDELTINLQSKIDGIVSSAHRVTFTLGGTS